jgi:hypothetical protein
MRRQWKVLVVVGALTLLAGLLFLLPPRGDGLDWVRKYGGTESRYKLTGRLNNPDGLILDFRFQELPEPLLTEARSRLTWGKLVRPMSTAMIGSEAITVDWRLNTISLTRFDDRPWIERQWSAFKRLLGI